MAADPIVGVGQLHEDDGLQIHALGREVLQQLEGPLQPADRVFVGDLPHRRPGGGASELDGVGGVAGGAGLEQVVGNLGRTGDLPLERGGDRGVGARPPAGRDFGDERGLDDGVHEPEPVEDVGHLHQQSEPRRSLDVRQSGVSVEAGCGGDHR